MLPDRLDSHSSPGRTWIRVLGALLLLCIAASLNAQTSLRPAMEPPDVRIDAPPVVAPPESFFTMISNRVAHTDRGRVRGGSRQRDDDTRTEPRETSAEDRAAAQARIDDELAIYRNFYGKYIDVNGLPVVAHADIADLALQRTYEIVTRMLAGRPDILDAMAASHTYLIILGKNQLYTDMPEYRNHPNPDFMNERVRGTGGNPTSFGEENLLSLPIDRYDDESIAVHEFAHTIDSALRRIDPTWTERRNAAYRNAIENQLYHLAYASTNPGEYWAEIVQAYFDCNRVNNWNHGPIGNRDQLRAHDPVGYDLCRTVFNLDPDQDWRYTWLQPLPMVSTPPATPMFKDIDPWYTRFTWAREFTVLGRSATDDALLHANRTIRNLFAYRHDILKALIADGVKLVVLGPNETLADLPEFRSMGDPPKPDAHPRFPIYCPETSLLVVEQENVLGDPASPPEHETGDNQVIRVLADALYRVAGLRPAIPDYQGDQQYELRVKRLDVEFDHAVTALFEEATTAGRWNDTTAATDRFNYWSAGVLAYFDAAGRKDAPADSTTPINTRERLKSYDPGLFSLVHETMAYENRMDWRYEPFRAEPSQVEQRRERPAGRASGSGVYRASVTPHWFADNTKFWYRNELPGGAREFILVDAERGTRQYAFDHQAVARQMADGTDATHLPVESLRFSDDGHGVVLVGRDTSWTLDLNTGDLRQTSFPAVGFAEGLPPRSRPRPTTRTGPESEITFDNRLDREVAVFWLDTQGRRQSYGTIEPRGRRVQHTFGGHVWLIANDQGDTLAVFEAGDRPDVAVIDDSLPDRRTDRPAPRERGRPRPDSSDRSPDGQWTAVIRDHNVFIRDDDGDEIQLSTNGHENDSYGRVTWSPDSSTVIAWRIAPGDRKQVHLIRSSPEGGGRAQLESRPYALPGDRFPRFELNLFDVATLKQTKPDVDRFEHQWLSPRLRWTHDETRFTYLQVDRGHQRLRVIEVNPATGAARNIIDERSQTFIWTAHTENLRLDLVNWLDQTDEIIHVSERDGWRHLYLVDIPEASTRQITRGEWVVRGIDRIDETARQIWFSAGGRHPDQDPYFLHHYRVNFDGTGLVALTDGNGTHSIEFSPDQRYVIDTWSRVDAPPVIELRRTADGSLVCQLEQADISELIAGGWTPPEPFVAKGRDGETDIYGLIHRPRDLDPTRQYPVIESIYAGPQGSFVPKPFSPAHRFASLTDLGFIVVQIDGMGTANRSKAFHDVCHKNLKDGGFPDRILWMQAAARQYPYMDLSRVGIYGNSAGGQNAAAAVLFHPDFYKAAVASCGCHDNRMDKASWNEQWMGYLPPDKLWNNSPDNWYSASSNIDNAHRLQGNLFLIVGEMDTNVPPESTLRLVDALIRADKDFDLLVIPNGGHGMGGSYGQRRMRDFFVRHLLGK
jgi:dipeptidyl-peptidase 4